MRDTTLSVSARVRAEALVGRHCMGFISYRGRLVCL